MTDNWLRALMVSLVKMRFRWLPAVRAENQHLLSNVTTRPRTPQDVAPRVYAYQS